MVGERGVRGEWWGRGRVRGVDGEWMGSGGGEGG